MYAQSARYGGLVLMTSQGKIMKLSKEQKEALAEKLSMPWGGIELECDGYLVALRVERYTGMTYRVMTYVNGVFKGEWCYTKGGAAPVPETKFLRKSVRPNIGPAKRKQLEKNLGKRYISKDPYWSGTQTFYLPDWSSGKAAINHLCKVCESVQVSKKTDFSALEKEPA
jgi:hypothetical protein